MTKGLVLKNNSMKPWLSLFPDECLNFKWIRCSIPPETYVISLFSGIPCLPTPVAAVLLFSSAWKTPFAAANMPVKLISYTRYIPSKLTEFQVNVQSPITRFDNRECF